MKCPHCKEPGEQKMMLVCVRGGPNHGCHQRQTLCSTCGGTNEIGEERARKIAEGEAMRRARLERDETQREAAAKLGMDVAAYSKLERGSL